MFEKVSKILLGVIIGVIIILLAWYLISGWTGSDQSATYETKIKDNLLSNPVISTVRDKVSVVNFPIIVDDKEIGVNNPF
jgi:hypothetical protein